MSVLWGDTETRSRCDLKQKGAYNYALDASTGLLCFCYAFDDEDVQVWTTDQPFPDRVAAHIKAGGQLRFHNAAFDRLIMSYVLGIGTELEQWYCTATQARANCMPGALGDVGRFVGAGMRKDYRGAQLIRWLSIPRADGTFNEDPKLMQEMVEYCAQDVRAMRAASLAMRELTDEELYDYHVNERVNDLGVRVDVELCEAAIKHSEEEKQEIERLVYDITNGEVPTVRSRNMCQWVYDRVGPEARKLMEQEDGKISIDKNVRANLLSLAEEQPDEVPVDPADVIQCADDLWASSVAKFKRFASLADPVDHRVRGAFVFAGGAATGRAASYGTQLHNMSRKCAENPEETRAAIVGGLALDDVGGTLKSMLRPAIIPADGHVFVVADWSAIEGRVNPWLSNTEAGERKLQDYRDRLDPYKVNAAALYGVAYDEVTKEMRQVGKVQELGLGYLGGAGAFDVFASVYGIRFSPDEVDRAVKAWRRANPWAMAHGRELEQAYLRAMRNPKREFKAARTTYMFDGTHLWYALPSGRILCYPFAKVVEGSVTYAKASWKPAADAKEWPRATIWPGLAIENLTQAAANDILRHALRELDDLYYRITLHVHDEIVLEVPEADADRAVEDMTAIMTAPPAWAAGLPLDIEVSTMKRYGK